VTSYGDEDQDPVVGWSVEDGSPITRSMFVAAKQQESAAQEAFGADVRRLLFQELDDGQLDTVRELFRRLATYDNPSNIVNFYEGLTAGAAYARRLARPDALDLGVPATLEAHDFVDRGDGTWRCGFSLRSETGGTLTCGLPAEAKPHHRAGEQ
jgi:hypothetical protein